MPGLITIVALTALLPVVVLTLMLTVVAGVLGGEPPLRMFRPFTRRLTAKVEMVAVDREYRELLSR